MNTYQKRKQRKEKRKNTTEINEKLTKTNINWGMSI